MMHLILRLSDSCKEAKAQNPVSHTSTPEVCTHIECTIPNVFHVLQVLEKPCIPIQQAPKSAATCETGICSMWPSTYVTADGYLVGVGNKSFNDFNRFYLLDCNHVIAAIRKSDHSD